MISDKMVEAAFRSEMPDALSRVISRRHIRALLTAALSAASCNCPGEGRPAASGVHPDALPDGTLSKSTAKRVEALAAASVSERALVSLDMNNLPAEWPWDEGSPCLDPRPVGMVYPAVPTPRAFGYLDKTGVEWAAYDTGQMEEYGRRAFADGANTALRAIEQALTQQRGALPSAETFASAVWRDWMTNEQADKLGAELRAWVSTHLTTPSDAGGEAVAEPFAWFAWGDHNGPVPLELFGWDEKACKYAVLTYARSQGWKGTVTGFLLHNGWTLRPAYATTPQPSADAVREYVTELRAQADQKMGVAGACAHDGDRARYKSAAQLLRRVADELESLLSAASGEKGVGNG